MDSDNPRLENTALLRLFLSVGVRTLRFLFSCLPFLASLVLGNGYGDGDSNQLLGLIVIEEMGGRGGGLVVRVSKYRNPG